MFRLYHASNHGNLYQGDCKEVMKAFADNCFDTIITDPPYAIGFMGQKWDYEIPDVGIWQECLRVLKPGGTALVFAGSRTQHRMACNIEDAGFILKDCVMWLYGSGFPKALDIEKKLMKKEEEGEALLWKGWKSHGLKPAYEPILVCIKPNEGSYIENALAWGVAGLNIDEARIATKDKLPNSLGRYPANIILDEEAAKMLDAQTGVLHSGFMKKDTKRNQSGGYHGGFPQDRIGERDTYGDKGGASRFFYVAKASKAERDVGCKSLPLKIIKGGGGTNKQEGDDNVCGCYGSVKVAKHNYHPTVKPLKLMEYLCRITSTPTKGILLDPFIGSGTTAIAAERVGRKWVGVEQDEGYCEIAKKRILRSVQKGEKKR